MAGVDRGVSTVVGYVLNLGIATILVTGLLISGASLVDQQRERTVRAELDVIGNRIAADLEMADRLLRTGDASVTVRSDLPRTVAGSDYSVEVQTDNGTVSLALETSSPSITRSIPVRNVTPIQQGTVSGGDLRIETVDNRLVVTDG